MSSPNGTSTEIVPAMGAFDKAAMSLALAMGKRGLGRCWPNPAVGAVVASPSAGRIVSCACTAPGGRPHAEAIALAQAGEAARGATLYVTLEPCSHWGVTPPCADAAITAGIARLVYGVADPDPRVSGAGLERLRSHGVEVVQSAQSREARWLTLGHILRATERRPFVQIKLATGADGSIPAGNGAPVWVTGEQARARAHLLRAEADAILIGHGTLTADNPALTCRLPGLGARTPVRVVLAHNAAFPASARMLETLATAPVWVFCGTGAPPENIARLKHSGAECIALPPQPDGRLPIADVLAVLAERGITRLMVEGGPAVAESVFAAGAADEFVVFRSGTTTGTQRLQLHAGLAQIAQHAHYNTVEIRDFGGDLMTVYRRASFWPDGKD